jgi:YggT family protein
MQLIMRIVGNVLSAYSLIIFVRILLSWFSGAHSGFYFGRVYYFLRGITDPYLNYFRRFRLLRLGSIDLSPIAAFALLTIACNCAFTIAAYGKISLGFVLVLALKVIWSALSFILGFFALVVGLRLAAYLMRANIYHPFWHIIESISAPILFRTRRFFFALNAPYLQSMIITLVFLLALLAGGGALVGLMARLLLT